MEKEIRLGSFMGRVLHDVGVNKALFVGGKTLLVPSAMSSFLVLGGTARLFDGRLEEVLLFEPHVVVAETYDDDLGRILEKLNSIGIFPDLFLFSGGQVPPYSGDVYLLFLDDKRKMIVLGKMVNGVVERIFEYEISCRLLL